MDIADGVRASKFPSSCHTLARISPESIAAEKCEKKNNCKFEFSLKNKQRFYVSSRPNKFMSADGAQIFFVCRNAINFLYVDE